MTGDETTARSDEGTRTARENGRRPLRFLPYGLLVLLYLLHNDLWLWTDATRLLALPVGLTYHVLYCLATVAVMALLVRWAWPRHLEELADEEESPGTSAEGGGRR